MARPTYKMTISLHVLDHLGLNLYSSIPAVLSEAVANAWDADALTVHVTVDRTRQTITIKDDGLGMDQQEINDKYLMVGYRRRDEQDGRTTPSGRHVMGRKGIGKLSLFAIADEIEVHTVKRADGDASLVVERNAFRMRSVDIRQAALAGDHYEPEALNPSAVKIKSGTKIVLRGLKGRATAATSKALRTRIARRFAVIGPHHRFDVSIDRSSVGPKDRDYFKKVEFIWQIGDRGAVALKQATSRATKRSKLAGTIDPERGWAVEGWVATTFNHNDVDTANRVVVVLANGRLVHEDLLVSSGEGGLFTKYLIGELRADFLDADELEDMTTSDRQRLKEDDERYETLTKWFNEAVLRTIGSSWRSLRNQQALAKARVFDAVEEWHATLSPDERRAAAMLFGRIGTVMRDSVDDQRELYRHTILAFERLKVRRALTEIEQLPEIADVGRYQRVFGGLDDVETVEYGQIAAARLEIIKKFQNLTPEASEKIIQRYLHTHLWLLHPSWERPTTSPRTEETVGAALRSTTLSQEEKRGRIDIRYATAANKHIVIELKRFDVRVDAFVLARQLNKYRQALGKALREQGQEYPNIELIAILGHPPTGIDEPQRLKRTLADVDGRYVLYNQLIDESLAAYQDYLDANHRASRLNAILKRLEPIVEGDG